MKYKIRFWFEHGGYCLWGMNEAAKNTYGYPVDACDLPLSLQTIKELEVLELEYGSYLNWSDPAGPTLWTKQQEDYFLARCNNIYAKMVSELGDSFDLSNDTNKSICYDR